MTLLDLTHAVNCNRCGAWNELGAREGEGQCSYGHAHSGYHLSGGRPASLWQGPAGLLERERVW